MRHNQQSRARRADSAGDAAETRCDDRPQYTAPSHVTIVDLEHPDLAVRRAAARRIWAIISRLDAERAERLYHRYADAPPRSPEWRVAELARLQMHLLQQERDGGDLCPPARCRRSGLWVIVDTGDVLCMCGAVAI